jgi:hypothetical protein
MLTAAAVGARVTWTACGVPRWQPGRTCIVLPALIQVDLFGFHTDPRKFSSYCPVTQGKAARIILLNPGITLRCNCATPEHGELGASGATTPMTHRTRARNRYGNPQAGDGAKEVQKLTRGDEKPECEDKAGRR